MDERRAYECLECGNKIMEKGVSDQIPECCGKEMEQVPIEVCDKDPSWAEHARLNDDDEPCDPGITGKI